MAEHISYADAGVDVDEGARAVDLIRDAVASTDRPGVMEGLGGFGCLFDVSYLKGLERPVLVSGTDGVGTKLALAQRLGRHDTVGEDLVAMCADDVVVTGAQPLFFLDYIAVGKLQPEAVAEVVQGIAAGCREAGCALIGGEMAEHPGVMAPTDYDLAGFCVGAVDAPAMLGANRVREGDVILGLPSSGIHSNGYSLVRAAVTDRLTDEQLTEPRGDLGGESLADALLRPTRIYAGAVVRALEDGAPIHALAHITGGGITENLNRVLPSDLDALVDAGDGTTPPWEVPPIIDFVIDAASLTPEEAYKTLNMGVGMAVVCDPDDVDQVSEAFDAEGLEPFLIGEVVSGTGTVRYC